MKIFEKFILFSMLFSSLFAENCEINSKDEGWNKKSLVTLYMHNSELQTQWGWEALSRYRLIGNERILDFGCGDGKLTALISFIVPNGSVFGVDLSSEMIHVAQKLFPRESYPNLTFQESLDLDFSKFKTDQKFDVIVSFCVFHLIPHPMIVLQNLKNHLIPGGKLIITLPTGISKKFSRIVSEEMEIRGWHFPSNHSSERRMNSVASIQKIMEEAGFKVDFCETLKKRQFYGSKKELVDWLEGTLTANWNIPYGYQRDFFETVTEKFLDLYPEFEDEEGFVSLSSTKADIIATAL